MVSLDFRTFFFYPEMPKSQLFIVKQDNRSLGHLNPQSVNTICEALLSNVLSELHTEDETYSKF